MDTLPLDLKIYIGKIVWELCLHDVHRDLEKKYKIGISTLHIRNGHPVQRKVFVYENFNKSSYKIDSKFYEVAKHTKFIKNAKAWERIPYNYRDLSATSVMNEKGLSPGFMCIKNENENICVLPRRYIYSKPMSLTLHNKYKVYIQKFRERFETTKSIRAGCV